MKRFLAALILTALAACTPPESSGIKVIVGAKLIAAPGRAPIEYSVIVIEDGKFREVGPQSTTPVPKGAEITRGLGMTVEPAPDAGPIEPGRPADLVMSSNPSDGSTRRVMRDGQWVPQ